MLQRIVNIINSSSSYDIDNGTLCCHNVSVTDSECIAYIDEKNILENTLNQQPPVNLELTLARLNSIGYYEDTTAFILKNRYIIPNNDYYIEELKCYNIDNNDFINKYTGIISLINSIKNVARHTYTEINISNALIFCEDKILLLPFIYDEISIQHITTDSIIKLGDITNIFLEQVNSDKKNLFINELIEFLIPQSENNRFNFLLLHMSDFEERANSAYQYYIRNFSYNKLKTELDNAALDYSKKIQSIINEAQTKLIAIPTAFVLAVASMDFDNIFSNKNIGIICSLFIFSWLIDLFIRNQKSALRFISHNILEYKGTFNSQQNKDLAKAFSVVDDEEKKQKKRLNIVHWITWGLPISLVFTLLLIYLNLWQIIVLLKLKLFQFILLAIKLLMLH